MYSRSHKNLYFSYTMWCDPNVFDHLPLPYAEGISLCYNFNIYINSDFFTQNLGPNKGVFTILKMGKNSQKSEESSQVQ